MLVQVTVISFKQVTASSLFTPQITMYSLTFLLDNVRFYSIFIVSAIIGSIFIKRWRNFYSNKFLTYFKMSCGWSNAVFKAFRGFLM
jgi:hypothetical protein